jgi:hypothetical protein
METGKITTHLFTLRHHRMVNIHGLTKNTGKMKSIGNSNMQTSF